MSYDTVLQVFGDDAIPLDFQRLIILGSYCEFIGKRPESSDHAGQNHMILLKGIAAEAKLLLGRKEERKKSRWFVKFRRIDICYLSSVLRLPKMFPYDSPFRGCTKPPLIPPLCPQDSAIPICPSSTSA